MMLRVLDRVMRGGGHKVSRNELGTVVDELVERNVGSSYRIRPRLLTIGRRRQLGS